jgi:predicted CopG family antitoxin
MPKKRHNFMLSDEAFTKLKRLAGIASMSAYLEKMIKDAKK